MSTATVARKLTLDRHSAGMLLTPAEFDAVTQYDDRYRFELIKGVLVVSPLPSEAEGDPNEELGFLLRSYQYDHPQGHNLDLTLPERYVLTENRRRADRVIWAGLGRVPDPEVDVPSIVAEFVSKGKRNQQRDYEEKRREYQTAGVQEYWLIDRFRRLLTVFRRKGAKVIVQEIHEGELYHSPLLPGFELDLARLLAVADKWSRMRKRKKKRS